MKWHYWLIFPLIFFVKGANAPIDKNIDLNQLSGNIQLTLKHGIWKLWEEKPVYQDITLDLVCDRGNCQPEVWGYAPKFNQDVDNQGTLETNNLEPPPIINLPFKFNQSLDAWRLKIKMQIQFNPWQNDSQEAIYEIELVPQKGKILGSYQGTFNQRFLQGAVTGNMSPHWPIPISNHRPITPLEHPRLIFRKDELPKLKETAKTATGKAILAQLQKTLKQPIYYDGYVPNGGYHAVGNCFLALINDDQKAAETGWKLTETSLKNPGRRILEQSPIVAGVALAYDLCYPMWNQPQITQVTKWLEGQTSRLIKGDSPRNGWNSQPASNWNARARGAAGLGALAILDEPITKRQKIKGYIKLSERHIKRYLSSAIGDRGFGIEGDHYTTEPFVLSMFPFLQAYRNVMGQDLVTGSPAQWILPHYVMRMIEDNGELKVATYGRHRYYGGSSLFSLGIPTVSDEFLPGIMELFNRYLGSKGNRTFGINSPEQAPFIFSKYNNTIVTQNPVKTFNKILVDEQKGFYNFRNEWQDKDDFVANIYLKKQVIGGTWSFPDVGSFRIWGLGGHWANSGESEAKWDEENVVVIPKSRPWKVSNLSFFASRPNGSGIVSLTTDAIVNKESNPPLGIQGLRSFAVDYSGASGVPGLFVVVDKFMGSVEAEEFKEKVWVMHTEGNVTIEGKSFIIKANNGATMKGTFVAPSQVKISVEKTNKGSKILARGGNEFFIIMTVQKGSYPEIKVIGTGLNSEIKIGNQQIYFSQNRIFLFEF
ncbi:hypothetical protein [Aphanothece sacrum]|uniref:Uncharacterized protein n=1 Tax=Aphanothece sacrum FPU1 TaxID=1920663 RepID=A0A401IDX0_APHSA|nr:hypothetical protein [Aphanothece sacrum]GBF79487.1 hypothetical protein AsFPU1_0883 [Aphanothece sacrum FPU1]GBF83972.1 hypothetical protein AsFPU3_1016 [Aphanothece sacrum FPU3]